MARLGVVSPEELKAECKTSPSRDRAPSLRSMRPLRIPGLYRQAAGYPISHRAETLTEVSCTMLASHAFFLEGEDETLALPDLLSDRSIPPEHLLHASETLFASITPAVRAADEECRGHHCNGHNELNSAVHPNPRKPYLEACKLLLLLPKIEWPIRPSALVRRRLS
jgi:hypothetical protein